MSTNIVEVETALREAEPNHKFWMIWNPNGYSPRYRHPTEDAARKEAQRLSRQSPTDCFIVLEAIARYEAAPPISVTELDLSSGDAAP